MIIPIRCFTCNKLIGASWEPYTKLLKEGHTEKEALDKLGLRRMCCRRMILTHTDLINTIIKY